MSLKLSKSDYMLFLKHPAWLWLKKHNKAKLPVIDDNTQAIFDAGNLFEAYAQKLFLDGKRLGFTNYDEYLSLPNRTVQALKNGTKTIFQGRFEHQQLTFIGDVISVVNENTVDLYEIKSSTKVKEEHLFDLAFQMVVLESLGYTVRDIFVLHVNSEYVKQGEINPHEFVITAKITDEVREKRELTKQKIEQALEIAQSKEMPDLSPSHAALGSLNDWIAIYRNLVPIEKESIYDLCTNNTDIISQLESKGIKKLMDIPDTFPLSKKQQVQVDAVKQGKVLAIPEKIKEFLDSLTFPLYFLDYETLSSIVPYFDGLHPYQQLPFQYSLHILQSPGAELQHKEYLHRDNSHPGLPLLQQLKEDIGSNGTILVWYEPFEKSRNKELGEMFPEYADFIQSVNNRIVDLMIPFSEGWYVNKDFLGSASIKKVLPVLVPDLSYTALNIHEGAAAQRLWMEAVLYGKRDSEKEQILADLIRYCGLDTLAMVEIYRYLYAFCS